MTLLTSTIVNFYICSRLIRIQISLSWIMAVLLDLPTELLSHVVSYLDHDYDLEDLLSSSLTTN
jgi:hypothetical protein